METNTQFKQWWLQPEGKLHETLGELVKFLKRNQAYKHDEILDLMNLYSNFDSRGMAANQYNHSQSTNPAKSAVTYNLIQSAVDTLTAKIGKNRVRPMFLTDGGTPEEQAKAEKLNKFVEGQFYATRMYEKAPIIFRDACVPGTGILKVYSEEGEIKIDRVLMSELIVDDAEAVYGMPRQIHQEKYIARDVLKSMFPKFENEIETVDRENLADGSGSIADQILVTESWHLPSNKDAKNGKKVIWIKNATLDSVPYKKDRFPFAFLRLTQKMMGFWGQGSAERLRGLQLEIKKLLRRAQLSMHLNAVPRWLVEINSKVPPAKITNEVGAIVHYSGTKPELQAANSVPREILEHIRYLIQLGFEQEGISQLSAASQKPAGLDSGKALREYNDIESERFIQFGQAFEQWFLDASVLMIDEARAIFTEQGKFSVKAKGKKFLETIEWKEIDLDEDEYMMQVYPTSALSKTPSGRLNDVQEMVQGGMIPPEIGLKLLDMPDTESYMSLKTAPYDDIMATISQILEKGNYQSPEPFQNLKLGLELFQSAYLRAKLNNVSDQRLELMRIWMTEANQMLTPDQPSPAETMDPSAVAAGGPPPMMPEGNGAPVPEGRASKPPVSPLLPYQLGGAPQ